MSSRPCQELSLDMIWTLYSRFYNIRILRVCPADLGHFGVRRDRIYIIMTLKEAVIEVADPIQVYAKVKEYVQSFVRTEPKDCCRNNPIVCTTGTFCLKK